jgi:hypothetical protein
VRASPGAAAIDFFFSAFALPGRLGVVLICELELDRGLTLPVLNLSLSLPELPLPVSASL